MVNNILEELNIQELRARFLKFTRNAYQLLPKIVKPRVLDIGCGTGLPTIELAKLSEGEVIGLDIDKNALDLLNLELEKRKLLGQIKTINCSIYEFEFPDQSFNVIWEEGVIHLLDLNKVLTICYKLLKNKGCLVMFETIARINDKFKIFSELGFILINYFLLPEAFWWTEYYLPLKNFVKALHIKYKGSKQLEELKQYEREIDMVKKDPKKFDCGFYIMQKNTLRNGV